MDTSEIVDLFGELIDSAKVAEFFGKHASFRVSKPESGRQYAVSKELGVDLMFEPDDGMQGGRTKHMRKCQCAFLYAHNVDGHAQFKGRIPFGFEFQHSRDQLIEKEKPERTWKIGEGEVPVEFKNPSHDRWKGERYTVSAHYNASGAIMYFVVKATHA